MYRVRRRVARGQHEAVAAGPVGVRRVVPHHLLEERVRGGGQAHRRTGVAVADLLYGVRGQDAGGVDGPLVQIGPLEVCGGRLGAHPGSGLLSTCRRTPGDAVPTAHVSSLPPQQRAAIRSAAGRRGTPAPSAPARAGRRRPVDAASRPNTTHPREGRVCRNVYSGVVRASPSAGDRLSARGLLGCLCQGCA